MAGLRDLKRRIKSVQGTRKITRAMQMVSAAKMRKAQTAVVNSRTYSDLAWELVESVIPAGQEGGVAEHVAKLMKTYPKAKKVGVVLLATNGGLVGSLNSNLGSEIRSVVSPFMGSKKTADESANYTETIAEVVVYGKKAKLLSQRLHLNIAADFAKADKNITTQDIYPLAKYITEAYGSGEYSKIVLVYNKFVSTLVQKPTVKQLLPFVTSQKGSAPIHRQPETPINGHATPSTNFLFEPTPQQVLEHLLPRIIESQIYQAILESNASEHSARMVMMKNATEAAGDLIADYTLTYNQLRQNKITTELAEITAGKIALE